MAKIAFSGAQCTGKSTLINKLKSMRDDFVYIGSPSRNVDKEHINESGGEYGQNIVVTEVIRRSFIDNTIQDRCLLDSLAYSKYLYEHKKTISERFYIYNFEAAKKLLKSYDVIFYLDPEFDLIEDGVRSPDNDFRNIIAENFRYLIIELDIKVVQLTGDVDSRMRQITTTFDQLGV